MNSFTEEDLNNIETTDSIIMASKQRIQYFNSIDIDLDYLKEGVDYFQINQTTITMLTLMEGQKLEMIYIILMM